jgi:hypothetical protein
MACVLCRGEKAADRIIRPGGPKLFNDLSAAIAAGLGFGAMHTIMMYGAMLYDSSGEAAYYIDTCPAISMFIVTGAVWCGVLPPTMHRCHLPSPSVQPSLHCFTTYFTSR